MNAIILALGSGILIFLMLIRSSKGKKKPADIPRGMLFATSVVKKRGSYDIQAGGRISESVSLVTDLGLIHLYPNKQVSMFMAEFKDLDVFWLEDPITGLPIQETCAFASQQVSAPNGKAMIKVGDGEFANITWQMAGMVKIGRYKKVIYVYHPKTVKANAQHIFYLT